MMRSAKNMMLASLLTSLPALKQAAAWPVAYDADCHGLWEEMPKLLPNLTVEAAEAYPDNTNFTDPYGFDQPYAYSAGLAAFCRFAAYIKTSNASDTYFEVWMPAKAQSRWNGRFAMVGNGGVTGSPFYHYMSVPLSKYNFAVAGTNTGHWGVPGNGSYALNSPEKQIDFGYRSVHLTTVYSKKVIQAYYEKKSTFNYWLGCSTGGRQGAKAIQDFPDDFDGALIGDPVQFNGIHQGQATHVQSLQWPNATNKLSDASFNALAADVMTQCDADDGVKDGVIIDPLNCKPDFSKFLCGNLPDSSAFNATTCLNQAQVDKVVSIYANWTKPDGTSIYPQYEPGSEYSWASRFSYPPAGTIPSYFLYQVLNVTELVEPLLSPPFLPSEEELLKLTEQAVITNPGNPDAIAPPTAFFAKGGKFIQYHGWADSTVPPKASLLYRDIIVEALGEEIVNKGSRFFMIPGMGHCSGGPGASNFGTGGQLSEDRKGTGQSLKSDPQHDAVLALMEWVENGNAPDKIIGAKYVDDDRRKGVSFTRPLCAWPKKMTFSGKGNVSEAENWYCQ